MKYRNPILPGFYSDPSICRVGEDFYLVNSSFEFFPGVPLWHSRDLVNWEQIGHVLTRESQLPLKNASTSGGIFAPAIRYHNGRFYMITTNVTGCGNFFVWTDDIRGEWSDPVPIDHRGIDPSLFWDEDGKVYYQGTGVDSQSRQGIVQFEVDPETGKILSEKKIIWHGTGGKCPEGPHMYKINGMYYLMIAEGGTEYGHMETIARSHNPWGPFESCPRNPILTHRDVTPIFGADGPCPGDFQGLGHGDLVEDGRGNWWMVFHGFRPSQNMLHHLGRETMLAPVAWDEDGWLVVNGGKLISAEMEIEDRPGPDKPQSGFGFTESFAEERELPPRWVCLREPVRENYGMEQGLVLISGSDSMDSLGSPTFVGVRQGEFAAAVETVLEFSPASEAAQAGITVYHTNAHHSDRLVTTRAGRRVCLLYRRACDLTAESVPVSLPESGRIRLRIEADRQKYQFFAGPADGPLEKVGEGCTQLLSTEVMRGTFTGCFLGLFCQGEPGQRAVFESFSYQPEE